MPGYPPVCFRGCGQVGMHAHIWWTCQLVQQFWTAIFCMASTLLKVPLDPNLFLVLLNHGTLDCARTRLCLLLQLMTAAKQTIAKAWKFPKLYVLEVKNRITQAMIHGTIKATIQDRIPQHLKIWQSWVEQFLALDFDESLLEP